LYSICMWISSSSFVNGTSSIGILPTSIPVSFFFFWINGIAVWSFSTLFCRTVYCPEKQGLLF
jgi:hypothetical protein